MLESSLFMWMFFIIVVLFLLAFDLGILHKKNHEISAKESLYTSAWYILAGLLFGGWIWISYGATKGAMYLTGFVIEKSLSLDNIFVISLIFNSLAIPRMYQYRILFWGVLGVVVLRGLMIGVGASIVAKFAWVLYIFAIFLIITGIKMMFTGKKLPDIQSNPLLKLIKSYFNVTHDIHGEHFFVRIKSKRTLVKKWHVTPLFLALVLIESMDLVFAIDSVPAILAITTDTYLIYTSNIFAILGLRALYFTLDILLLRFKYLKYSLAALLIFIGSKIFIADFMGLTKFPPMLALLTTFAILASGVIYSLYKTKRQ